MKTAVKKKRAYAGGVSAHRHPGRLLDHLRMTESFNVDNLRWLVLGGNRSIIRFRIRKI